MGEICRCMSQVAQVASSMPAHWIASVLDHKDWTREEKQKRLGKINRGDSRNVNNPGSKRCLTNESSSLTALIINYKHILMNWYLTLLSLLVILPTIKAVPLSYSIQYYPQVDTLEWCRQVCNRVQLCYDVIFSIDAGVTKCGTMLNHI